MSALDQISSKLQFAESKKHDLKKAFEDLQSHSSSLASLTLQWEDLQTHFDLVQSSIELQFERLKSKEIQLRSLEIALDRRAKELELKEWQLNRPIVPSGVKSEPLEDVPVNNGIDRFSSNANLRFCVTMDGRNLQLFLNENADNHGRMGNEVFAALRMSADPAKLVLDAMEGFYPPHLKNGVVEFEGAVVRRSCVLLLEQLTRVGPPIRPQVREEAARLAHEWKAKMGVEVGDSLEVLGFLWLLGAYRLTSDFDKNEILKHFENVVQHRQANELARALGLTDSSAGTGILLSQVMTNQSPSKRLELKNAIASSSVRPCPELKLLCINMDGKGLWSFLNEHVKEHDSIRCEVYYALQFAPDPAELVVDVLQVFDAPRSELNKGFKMGVIRKSCILLLEQLFRISPPIKPHVKEAAMKLAVDWKEKFVKKYEVPQKFLGFYLLLAIYGLASSFDPDELLGLLMNMDHSKKLRVTPDLCLALGLADKIPNYIQDLIERNLLSDAIQYIHVFELVDKFPPVSILKSYLNDSKWRVFKKEKNPHLREDDVMNKELTALRDVISCITEHHLESEYPPEDLEKRIEQLKKKADKKKFLEQQTKKKADKKCRRAVVPKPQPPQQSIPPQLPKQNAPEPQPPQHSAPEPQPSQQNAPESQLPQQSVPEPQLPNQNVLTPQRSQEIALTPQLPGESGPKSQPPQQSIFKPQPQPHSQPSQLIALKPQLSQITVIPQRPQQSIPKPQPPQQSGNKRPWTAMSAEAAPPTYFGASPTAHSIQPPLQRPVGYFINQAAPYLSMSAGHYRTPDRPYGLSGLPLGSPHSVAVNGLSRPYGPVGNLPGMGVANPNGFVHYYPRDALR